MRGARDGALVVARSDRDLLELALGGIPRSWRVPSPPGYPWAATPSEAQFVLEDIARGAAFSRPSAGEPLLTPPEASPLTREEELEFALTRGQAAVGAAGAVDAGTTAAAAVSSASDADSTRSMSSSSTNPEPVLPRPSR